MPDTPPAAPAEAIIWYNLDDLIIWAGNYNEGDIGAIAYSIRRFGFNSDPRTWHGPNVRGGNHTVQALALIKREGPNPDLDLQFPPARIRVTAIDDWYLPCADISHLSESEAIAFAIADNRIAARATQDTELLLEYLEVLRRDDPIAYEATGYDDDEVQYLQYTLEQALGADGQSAGAGGAAQTPEQARQTLAERFIIPPFSVLDARQGYWQERKRAWIALGIQSEVGRGENALGFSESAQHFGYAHQNARPGSPNDNRPAREDGQYKGGDAWVSGAKIKGKTPAVISGSPMPLDRAKNGKRKAAAFGQDLMRGEHVVGENGSIGSPVGRNAGLLGGSAMNGDWVRKTLGEDHTGLMANGSGTSIFDPVICELAYSWFCPPDGTILDPFAGGSVRGITASRLGRQYTGIDLRPEQIQANEKQAQVITPDNPPRWIVGNSMDQENLLGDQLFDFLFSCPPYFDLEIYSDIPGDLSNADDYDLFLADYRAIIGQCMARLKEDRFACFVVGDMRDKKGMYRNFVSDTIAAFIDTGAYLYNEAILVTSVGSLPIRVGKQFTSGRKLGKTHQNVLVFIKGDPKKAVAACGDVDVYVPDEPGAEGESEYGNELFVP